MSITLQINFIELIHKETFIHNKPENCSCRQFHITFQYGWRLQVHKGCGYSLPSITPEKGEI